MLSISFDISLLLKQEKKTAKLTSIHLSFWTRDIVYFQSFIFNIFTSFYFGVPKTFKIIIVMSTVTSYFLSGLFNKFTWPNQNSDSVLPQFMTGDTSLFSLKN